MDPSPDRPLSQFRKDFLIRPTAFILVEALVLARRYFGDNKTMTYNKLIKVAQASEIKPGEMTAVMRGDEQILLVNVDGIVFCAIDNVCSHDYACLSDGKLNGVEVECPLHGGSFNAYTGQPINPPATNPVRQFQVIVEGDDIFVGPPRADNYWRYRNSE